jgi:ataxia telangiectasia mutated family protein
VSSKAIKERNEAMVTLRQILRHNQGTSKIDNLKDSALFKIYDTIFQAIYVEVTQLRDLRAGVKSKTTIPATETRLSSCSTTLRVAVEVGVRNIRSKTVRVLIDHIIANFNEPVLSTDYAKNLSVILSYEPHVEHLPQDYWKTIMDFCLEKMKLFPQPDVRSGSSILTSRSSRSHLASSQAKGERGTLPRHVLDDLVNVVRSLVSVSFAPLLHKGSEAVDVMAQFLHSSPHSAKPQVDAVVVINTIMLQIRMENVKFAKEFTCDALTLTKSLWNTKLSALKDELLSMLILLHPFVDMLAHEIDNEPAHTAISNLLETMKGEYIKRPIKDQLQLSQLSLRLNLQQPSDGLRGSVFALNDGQTSSENASSAEHNWTLLKLLAQFSCWSQSFDQRDGKRSLSPGVGPQKRQRVAQWSDELFRMLSDFSLTSRLCSLQIVCFVGQYIPIEEEVFSSLIEKLSILINDDNSLVASWAYLALAR